MYKYKYFNNAQCANIQFIFEASVASQIYDYTIAVILIAEKYIHVRTPGAELLEIRHQAGHRKLLDTPPTLFVILS